MFTGIVKAVGTIAALQQRDGDVRMRVDCPDVPWADYEPGESIAVNGACLTAVSLHDNGFETDVSVETLDVTALGQSRPGARVNLEPALSLSERLGGHLVSGHIDCRGTVTAIRSDARSIRINIEIPEPYARYVAKKGSICVDGVSLTINEVSGCTFESNIIPHTAEMTIIGEYVVGTVVNIEVDLLARYLERLLDRDDKGLSEDFLRVHGYA
jgi:riboflavin synthase